MKDLCILLIAAFIFCLISLAVISGSRLKLRPGF